MSVQFNCPKCKQKLNLTASKPGDWIDCPACEATVQIPGGEPKPAARPATARPAPARAPVPTPDDSDEPAAGTDKRVKIGILAGAVALLLVGAAVAAIALQKPKKAPEQVKNEPSPNQPAPSPTPPKPKEEPKKPKEDVKPKPVVPEEQPKPELAEVVLTQTKLRTLKLGVSQKEYDDVGAILTSLGKGYAFTTLSNLDLENAERLKEFDVVFLNCGAKIGRPDRVRAALREFVGAGKSLYASDQQYPLIAAAFPDASEPKKQTFGVAGTYAADVLDPGLEELLGKSVDLAFNLDDWMSASFAGDGVTTILRAGKNGRLKMGTPLLVKFGHEQGTVFFTSFHNSVIASDTAKKLLRYLVFSAVLADAEGRVLKVLKRADYTVKAPELLTASDTAWSATRKHVQARDGLFRVGVAFNNEGAELKLVLEGPGGVRLEKEGKDAFIVDVRYATAGEWKITLSATKLPYPNFPVSLVLAEPK